MPKRRLGVALLVPPPAAAEVDGLRRALGDPSLARIPPHLTLAPPVNVREDRLPDALAVLRRAAGAAPPLRLVLGPPGTFLPVNPVVHLAVGGSPEALAALHALRATVFTEPLERSLTWPFVPHVTLADAAPPERIDAAMVALADYRLDVAFERLHLLQEGPGRVWAPIADAPLAPPAVVGRGGLELELAASSRLDPEVAALAEREWRHGDGRPGGGGEGLVVVARRDGRALGVARGATERDDGRLACLVVAPAQRRTGVGTHLLAAFLARASEAGCRRVTAEVEAGSVAEAFLGQRGWVPERALPAWRGGRDFVRLERRLGA